MQRHCLFIFLALSTGASAQSMPGMSMPSAPVSRTQGSATATLPEMSMPLMKMGPTTNLIDSILQHSSSGTTVEPPSSPLPMWMFAAHPGGWQFMLHANGFAAVIQQHASTNPTYGIACPAFSVCPVPSRRGADKVFSTNWIMPMAMHTLGARGRITLRTMLDLEPATITGRQYPELFQQGETAFGKPIVDGQHPHDFVMELAALYDYRAGKRTLLSLYAAPVGDPAVGPTAYPHRLSASEDPIAALGHHQQDSTHIAFNVLTGGITQGPVRIELSGFHGAEPNEAHWHFQPSPNGTAPDSYSARLTYAPTANIAAQYSIAHIKSPEALRPGEDQRRQTASLMYNRPIGATHDTTSMPGMDMGTPAYGNWATTLLWGQTLSLPRLPGTSSDENSYLLEALLRLRRNYAWTRIEIAGRSNELTTLPSSDEVAIGHVQAYTLGYDRDYRIAPHLLAAPGAQFTLYRTPDTLTSIYGRHPFGAVAFVRFRITQ